MKKAFILFLLFLVLPAFAGFNIYDEDIQSACGNFDDLYAFFEPFEYTCDSGYFLPADTLGCAMCPSGATCDGGIFKFNDKTVQGITYTAPITKNQNNMCSFDRKYQELVALFEPNQYTCAPGYYLPANTEGCSLCPNNSYCAGGIYTFNETTPQGIVSCGAGLYAPMGMWKSTQCGRILHVGDEIVYLHQTKKTSPALHIDIDNDGVADFFGNMTTLDIPMTRGTTRKLKLSFGGQTYSVYDDSINIGE